MADQYRNFHIDVDTQNLHRHINFIRDCYPFLTLRSDISGQHKSLLDLEFEDGVHSIFTYECKTDSHDTGNIDVELFSNFPYRPELDEVTNVIAADGTVTKDRNKKVIPRGTHVHNELLKIVTAIPENFKTVGLKKGLRENHFLSTYIMVTNRMPHTHMFYLMDLHHVQAYIQPQLDAFDFCLGHTQNKKTGAEWWALNCLIPILTAQRDGLILKEKMYKL